MRLRAAPPTTSSTGPRGRRDPGRATRLPQSPVPDRHRATVSRGVSWTFGGTPVLPAVASSAPQHWRIQPKLEIGGVEDLPERKAVPGQRPLIQARAPNLPGEALPLARAPAKDTPPVPLSTVIRKGTQLGGGKISFYPRSIATARRGQVPSEGGSQGDFADSLNVIIGTGATMKALGDLLLPLWNDSTPSKPNPNLGEPDVPAAPLTGDQLARGLAVYDSSTLGLRWENWKAGMRLPLPVLIDSDSGEGVVSPPAIQSLAGAFKEDDASFLSQPAAALAKDDASHVEEAAKAFLADKTEPLARGYALGARAMANAAESQAFVLACLRQMPDAEALGASLKFMEFVGHNATELSSTKDGVAILDGIRAVLAKASAGNDPNRQADLEHASGLLKRGREVEISLAVRDWPSILPRVKRGRDQHISKVSGKLELNIPDVPVRQLGETEKGIVQAIRDAREKLPAASDKLSVKPFKKDTQAGYFYAGSNEAAGAAAGASDPKRQRILDAIAEEISREGHLSAVNTYDDAVVTLASGFTRAKLADLMQSFFAADPTAQDRFLDIGIAWTGGQALVVNTTSGAVEEGDDALHLIQLEPRILSQFINLAEDPKHGPSLAAAQAKTLGSGPTNVPQSVVDTWTDMMAVRLVAHAIQWRSAKSWADYASTGGNVKAIVTILVSVVGASDAARGSAIFLDATQTGVLFSFAGGKAKEALASPAAAALPADIKTGSYAGHVFFDAGGGTFFHMSP